MMTAMVEFDDKPGSLREAVVEHMRRSQDGLVRAVRMAVETGELATDTDPEQFAFELFGIIATCYRSRNLFRDKDANKRSSIAFDRLVGACLAKNPVVPAAPGVSLSTPKRSTR